MSFYERWSIKARSKYGLHLDQVITVVVISAVFMAFELLTFAIKILVEEIVDNGEQRKEDDF